MIDNLALAITHGLMMLTALLLMRRGDLNSETTAGHERERPAPRA
ncbi:hypothetical protein [uncultured Sphingomonas sp.]